jgi:hypothetical protein
MRLFKYIIIKVRNKAANFLTVTLEYNIHVQRYVYKEHKTTMSFSVNREYLCDIYISTLQH